MQECEYLGLTVSLLLPHPQMDAELQQFNQDRTDRIRESQHRHEREFDHFNEESARMGFR